MRGRPQSPYRVSRFIIGHGEPKGKRRERLVVNPSEPP